MAAVRRPLCARRGIVAAGEAVGHRAVDVLLRSATEVRQARRRLAGGSEALDVEDAQRLSSLPCARRHGAEFAAIAVCEVEEKSWVDGGKELPQRHVGRVALHLSGGGWRFVCVGTCVRARAAGEGRLLETQLDLEARFRIF